MPRSINEATIAFHLLKNFYTTSAINMTVGEWITENNLGVHLSEIWPNRYFDENGQPIERAIRNNSSR
ncbi:helix-turn-helix domain-containing protein [Photorhabdus temperata]|uniref:helix-turn-helix domain-containing protein n=1 Tax=Photorhabdus temperata TaxID=574560 RepID=UPI0009DEB2EA